MKTVPHQTTKMNTGGAEAAAKERAIKILSGEAQPESEYSQVVANEETHKQPVFKSDKENIDVSPVEQETKSVEVTSDKSQSEELPAQYAQLARKERAILAKARELKAKEEAIKAMEAKLNVSSPQPSVDSSKYISIDDLKKDALGTLSKLGVTYDQIADQALNQPSSETLAMKQVIDELRAEINDLKGKQDNTVKTLEEGQKQAYTQAINQLKSDVKRLVSSDSNFETIAATDSVDDVVELIETHFSETGELLPVDEAARLVEEHLAEEAYKLSQLGKIKARLAKIAQEKEASAEEVKDSTSESKPAVKPLTNAVSSTRPLPARERAIAAMKGELK